MERNQTQSGARSLIDSRLDQWGAILGKWLPYATLAVALVLALLQGARLQVVLLAAAAAAWVYLMYSRTASDGRDRSVWMAVYFTGLLLFAALLMSYAHIFFLFAITGFFHASHLRPAWLMFVGVGATSVLVNTLITGFPWPNTESWMIFGTIILVQTLAIGFGTLLSSKLAELSQQRRQTVLELEAALEENAGLHAQLLTQAREAGVLAERQRLAGEIHDTLAQGLIGIITQLEAARQAGDGPAEHQRHLENAAALARESLTEARRSVQALHPEGLESASLVEAVTEVAQKWSALHGIPVEVHISGDPVSLHGEVETAIYRSAQEALANIARHAGATRVGLSLTYLEEEVILDVRDNGAGFEPDGSSGQPGAGFGLQTMRRRLARVGGELTIESEPGRGAVISARVPAIPAPQEVFPR